MPNVDKMTTNLSSVLCIFQRTTNTNTPFPTPFNQTDSGEAANSTEQYEFIRPPDPRSYSDIYQVITSRVVVIVCIMGLVGNFLAFMLLTLRWKRLPTRSHVTGSQSRTSAKSDISCFLALSVSDFGFCVVLIPQWYMEAKFAVATQYSFVLLYELCEEAVINTFVLSSTWLTVFMTMNRYLHLSHPMWSLRYLDRYFIRVAITGSVLFSVLLNIPRYWLYELHTVACLHPENTSVYYVRGVSNSWERMYRWSYFAVGIMIPLCCLVYGNARIICAVCKSRAVEQTRNQERSVITRTLLFVVFFYVCFLSPAEFIKFFEPSLRADPENPFLLVNCIANLLQAMNFSFNFVPYLIMDKSIRQSILDPGRQRRRLGYASQSTIFRGNGYTSNGNGTRSGSLRQVGNGGCVRLLSEQSMAPFCREFTRIPQRTTRLSSQLVSEE